MLVAAAVLAGGAVLAAEAAARFLSHTPVTIRRAHAVHPVAAAQTEYSLWTRDVEVGGVLDTCRELGIGFVGYSPMGRGFLTGTIRAPHELPAGDFRRNNPRIQGENAERNLEMVDRITALAAAKGVAAGQLALAWVLRQGVARDPRHEAGRLTWRRTWRPPGSSSTPPTSRLETPPRRSEAPRATGTRTCRRSTSELPCAPRNPLFCHVSRACLVRRAGTVEEER
jgi:hypothetical protein